MHRREPVAQRREAVAQRREAHRGHGGGPTPVVDLQRSAGNAAVSALLARQVAGPMVQRQVVAPSAGPRVSAGNGTTAELRAERERLVRERESLHVSTIEPETELRHNAYSSAIERLDVLLAERGNSPLPDAGVELLFDGATLSMPSGQAWPAVSGRPSGTGGFDYSPARQRLQGTGPIPAGVYYLDPSQLVDLSDRWFYFLRYEQAWGTHRITIHPFDSTHTFGRGGFFIHGGASAGSAGCIDLTSSMASFARQLGALQPGTKVKLTVRYPPPP